MDSVFHGAPPDMSEVDAVEDPSTATLDEPAPVELMNRVTKVMVNSMRDTYDLLARRIRLFAGLDAEEVAKIFSQGKVVEYEPGSVIFEKGDSGDLMYVILNGCVEIRDGNRCMAILHKGELFGEMALISREPRSASAAVIIRSSLLALSLEDIRVNLASNVAIQLLVNIVSVFVPPTFREFRGVFLGRRLFIDRGF